MEICVPFGVEVNIFSSHFFFFFTWIEHEFWAPPVIESKCGGKTSVWLCLRTCNFSNLLREVTREKPICFCMYDTQHGNCRHKMAPTAMHHIRSHYEKGWKNAASKTIWNWTQQQPGKLHNNGKCPIITLVLQGQKYLCCVDVHNNGWCLLPVFGPETWSWPTHKCTCSIWLEITLCVEYTIIYKAKL